MNGTLLFLSIECICIKPRNRLEMMASCKFLPCVLAHVHAFYVMRGLSCRMINMSKMTECI